MSPPEVGFLLAVLTSIGGLIAWVTRSLLAAHLERGKAELEQRLRLAEEEHQAQLDLYRRTEERAKASGMMSAVLLERLNAIDRRLGIESTDTIAEIVRASDPGGRLPTDRRRAVDETEAERVLERLGPTQYSSMMPRRQTPPRR